MRLVAEKVSLILDDGGVPLVIGGDCTITLGVAAAYVRRYPDLGLMYFDGDIDVSTPQGTVSGILDTMGMAHLLGDGIPELAHAGPRHPLLSERAGRDNQNEEEWEERDETANTVPGDGQKETHRIINYGLSIYSSANSLNNSTLSFSAALSISSETSSCGF